MQVASLVLGILSFVGMIVALTPCLGALNWLNIPFSTISLIIGIIALSTCPQYESKGMAITGTVLSAAAILFGTIRLIIGFGVV